MWSGVAVMDLYFLFACSSLANSYSLLLATKGVWFVSLSLLIDPTSGLVMHCSVFWYRLPSRYSHSQKNSSRVGEIFRCISTLEPNSPFLFFHSRLDQEFDPKCTPKAVVLGDKKETSHKWIKSLPICRKNRSPQLRSLCLSSSQSIFPKAFTSEERWHFHERKNFPFAEPPDHFPVSKSSTRKKEPLLSLKHHKRSIIYDWYKGSSVETLWWQKVLVQPSQPEANFDHSFFLCLFCAPQNITVLHHVWCLPSFPCKVLWGTAVPTDDPVDWSC